MCYIKILSRSKYTITVHCFLLFNMRLIPFDELCRIKLNYVLRNGDKCVASLKILLWQSAVYQPHDVMIVVFPIEIDWLYWLYRKRWTPAVQGKINLYTAIVFLLHQWYNLFFTFLSHNKVWDTSWRLSRIWLAYN